MDYSEMDKESLIKILKHKDINIKRLSIEKERLKYYASIDTMTGVLNRRVGLKLLRRRVNLLKDNDKNIVLCFIDIDRLKIINDSFGHEEGDKLIINTAKILKESVRKTDFIIRIGGDEFLIVFAGAKMKEVNAIWERICIRVEELNSNNNIYKLSLSYGFYEYSNYIKKNLSVNELIQKADSEMYKNKLKRGGF